MNQNNNNNQSNSSQSSGQPASQSSSQASGATNGQNSASAAPPPRRRRRWGMISLIAAATFMAGAVTAGAFGGGGPWMGHGGMGGPGGWHGRFMSENLDPVRIEARITRMVKHMGIEIDATQQQQDKLIAVAVAASKDLLPMRKTFRAARDQARALLTGPVIDREALEKLRAAQMSQADKASKRLAQALGDVAEILTPPQRKVINMKIERFKRFRKRWFRG